MNPWKKTGILSLILATLAAAPTWAQTATLQQLPSGTINWMEGWIEATGSGVPPADKPAAQGRLLAQRAATADAYRQLAETVYGVQVDSETTVRNFVTESDTVRTRVSAVLKGATPQGNPKHNPDSSVEIRVRLPLYGSNQLSGALGAESLLKSKGEAVSHHPSALTFPQVLHQSRVQAAEQLLFPLRLASAAGFVPLQFAQAPKYTGLVIDLCSSDIQPAMSPAIFSQEQVYIGNHPIDPEQVINEGVLQYYNDFDRALASPRVGSNPLVVEAIGTRKNRVDILIAPEEAARIQAANQNGQFLQQLKVVVATL